MDTLITQWINAMAGHFAPLDFIMITVSNYGVPALVLCIAIQWWSFTDRFHVRHAILSSGFSFILGLAINQIILLMIYRIRPYDAGITHLIIEPSADWSFPSDHATASFAAITGIAIHRLPVRATAILVLALLICISRIYVGTHYVTDVLGGVLTGVTAALLVWVTYREDTSFDNFLTRIF